MAETLIDPAAPTTPDPLARRCASRGARGGREAVDLPLDVETLLEPGPPASPGGAGSSSDVPPRRRGARWMVLVALALTTATVALAVPGRGIVGGQVPAFDVQRRGKTVAIRILNPGASAGAMTRQLQGEGLALTVSTRRASPQLVGTWVGQRASARVPRQVVASVREQTSGYPLTLEVPARFPGTIALEVGVASGRSGAPEVFDRRNALAPGGLLACRGLSGADPLRAADYLRDNGYAPVLVTGGRTDSPALWAPPPGARVVAAYLDDVGPTMVRLRVAERGDKNYRELLGAGFAPSQRQGRSVRDPDCRR